MLYNKYGKLSLSKVIPALWFLFLLYSLAFVYVDKEIPKLYYELTMLFSGVYVGRSALDKVKDNEKT